MVAAILTICFCICMVSADYYGLNSPGMEACTNGGYYEDDGLCIFKDESFCELETYAVDGCASETEVFYIQRAVMNSNVTVEAVVQGLKSDTIVHTVNWLVDIYEQTDRKADAGMCMAFFEDYGYDTVKEECVLFQYSGCAAMPNRFSTLNGCKQMVHSYHLYHQAA